MNDDFLFADDNEDDVAAVAVTKWKVLIIDDEPEVHNITRLVLTDFEFDNGALELVSAFSAAQAREMLEGGRDQEYAAAIVDVVMETQHAGLELVRWVREVLGNHKIRLILRTGQPGEAPEENVIKDYDINDYKNKTELTALRLKTAFYSALRGYRDILTIERHRAGLEKIISATSEFIECDTLPQFASAILKQVALVLGIESSSIICCAVAKENSANASDVNILAMNQGDLPATISGTSNIDALPEGVNERLKEALENKHSIYEQDYFIGYFTTKRGTENLLYLAQNDMLEEMQHSLLEFFANNIAVAHENLKLRDFVKESQKELSYVIGEAVEMRSKETGSHVKRVAHGSYLLAKLAGLSEYDAEMIKLASPLHDVGKVGIPDLILNKPGKHDENEWKIMKTHAQIGYEMLSKSENPILALGAQIAFQHHEKWDGSGYPRSLAGEGIDIAGRITALIDVFDALGSNRCYKVAWQNKDIQALIEKQSGAHFDPTLAKLLLDNIEEFYAIREAYPDSY
jgi:response regulator RpfG family c-di-GMP phosphodiesterase